LKKNKESLGEDSKEPLAKVDVEASPEFLSNLKILKKKYPNIRQDVEPVTRQLENGEVCGV